MKKNILAIIIGLMVCILFTEVLIGEALWLKERQESALFYLIKNRILAHLSPQDSNRLMGSSIRFSPHPAFIADKYLGYSYQPGQYEVTLAHSTGREHSFRLTIDKDGNRITSMTPGLFEGKKEVWVFGDSFVVGWGNNDETSFPFLLQQLLIDNKVVNYAVGGYGNIQGYLQLKRLINDTSAPGRHPEYIVIGYGDYYHDRNVATPSRLRGFR